MVNQVSSETCQVFNKVIGQVQFPDVGAALACLGEACLAALYVCSSCLHSGNLHIDNFPNTSLGISGICDEVIMRAIMLKW